ncbi:MAG: hypothetical protein GTN76_02095, partial [Candidatus Aenigmarchaeota archaeon]|nr:hypothetical protein [Candidatus Aenigmarchaeota archaeon]
MSKALACILLTVFILNVFWIAFFLDVNLPPNRFSGEVEKIDILGIEEIGEHLIYYCNFTFMNEINFSKIFKLNDIQFNLIEEGHFYSFKVNQFDMLSWFRRENGLP